MTIPNLNIIKRIWNQRSGIAQRRLALQKEEIKEETMETHRVMVTVSDPNHTMQTQRKTKIMKRVKIKANDKDHAIASAINHYKKAGYKVHDYEHLGRVHEEVEFVKAKYIEEGLGRGREDDEYHVPDPATTHKITHKVSHPNVEGGREHSRTVTISNSTKTTDQARKAARAHLEKQGYKIHEQTVTEGAYEKAEENKRSADAAKKQGDMFAHHLHMADHHDNMAQWHGEKGRHGEADRHAEKSEKHHEEAMKLKESIELDEAIKIGSKVKVHAPGKDYHDQVGHVGEIRHGAFKGAAKTYTVDYADGKSVQLNKKNVKLHTEEVELEEARGFSKPKGFVEIDKNEYNTHLTNRQEHEKKGITNHREVYTKHNVAGKITHSIEHHAGGQVNHGIPEIAKSVDYEKQQVKYYKQDKKANEDVAVNNVGGGNIAGTQGDAGKKAVMTKEPLKRKTFKQMSEECNCWKGYKRKPGTKPCEDDSCVKEESELDEGGLWANIHAKRKRIKNGSGERMRKPGEKGAPTAADFKAASESVEIDEAAIDAKGHKSSTGGLTQKGRDYYNNKTGGNLQAPVTTPPSKLDPDSKAAKRRKSFCARMSGVDGPMKDEKGRPTRKALALRKWNC